MRTGKKQAFSLVELILIVAFIGIFAVIAVPRLNLAVVSKQKADSVAAKIVTDLRLTRRLAVSHAADNSQGYKLKMIGSAPYAEYQIERADTAETVRTYTIDSKVSCTGGDEFQFGPLGNLLAGSDTQLAVTAEGRTFTITVIPATGAVKHVQN